MTNFIKENFTWDGMYLMYCGEYEGVKTFDEIHGSENVHPSRIGEYSPLFIARFKYGKKPWKKWVNFIVKNFTVEEYKELSESGTPLKAMESKGFIN